MWSCSGKCNFRRKVFWHKNWNKKLSRFRESGKCVIYLRNKLTLPVGKKKVEKKWTCLTHVCNFRRMKFLSNLCRTQNDILDTWIDIFWSEIAYLVKRKPSKTCYLTHLRSESSWYIACEEIFFQISLRTTIIRKFYHPHSDWRRKRADIWFTIDSDVSDELYTNIEFFSCLTDEGILKCFIF